MYQELNAFVIHKAAVEDYVQKLYVFVISPVQNVLLFVV